MPTPRHGIGAAVFESRIHIPGGGPVENFSVTDVHEVLDLALVLAPPVPAFGPIGRVVLLAALVLASRHITRRAHK